MGHQQQLHMERIVEIVITITRVGVLGGGCLGKGLFVFHAGNHEKHGNKQMKV